MGVLKSSSMDGVVGLLVRRIFFQRKWRGAEEGIL